jgi:hypothetical protein
MKAYNNFSSLSFFFDQHNTPFIIGRETSPIIFPSLFISYLNIPTYKNLGHTNISYISIIVVYSSTIVVLFSINSPPVKLHTNPHVETQTNSVPFNPK